MGNKSAENKTLLENATYGLSALKDLLAAIEGSGFATGTDSLKILSDVLDLIRTELTFERQPIAALNQDPPVEDTYYTILDTTANAKIYCIATKQKNDEASVENLQLKITIDGETIETTTRGHASNTWNFWYFELHDDELTVTTSETSAMVSTMPFEGRSVKIEVRQTTDVGTNAELDGRVHYAER